MSASAVNAPDGLLFNWGPPRRRKLAIATFLALSAIAHALCFYLFQVVYRPTAALLPPPARVSLITSSTEEGRALLRWIEAEDPAQASTTLRPPGGRAFTLPEIAHVPSYATVQPALHQLPPLQPDLRLPSAFPPGSVRLPRAVSPSGALAVATAVTFSGELEQLGVVARPEIQFTSGSEDAPQNIRFSIAVDEDGAVRHTFAQNSSGDPALDEQARHYLALCRFPHLGQQLTWGRATITWGSDVARPKPSASPPKP